MAADLKPEEATPVEFKVVELLEVTVPLPTIHGEVTLVEQEAPYRTLTFPIALQEAGAIAAAQKSQAMPRPTTHELFSAVLRSFTIDVIALRITSTVDGVLYAEIDLMGSRGREIVSCRPSDGIVLCLRQVVPAPILVADEVLGAF